MKIIKARVKKIYRPKIFISRDDIPLSYRPTQNTWICPDCKRELSFDYNHCPFCFTAEDYLEKK